MPVDVVPKDLMPSSGLVGIYTHRCMCAHVCTRMLKNKEKIFNGVLPKVF